MARELSKYWTLGYNRDISKEAKQMVKTLADRVITLTKAQANLPKDSQQYKNLDKCIEGILDKILEIPDGYTQYNEYLSQI